MLPYVSVSKGRLTVRKDERIVINLDTRARDFQKQLEQKLYENHVYETLCSSSVDFPEDFGAPRKTGERFSAALEAAVQRMIHEGILIVVSCTVGLRDE